MSISTYVNKALLSLVCECRSLCIVWTERALRGRQPLVLSRLQPPEGLNIRGGNSELPRVWQLTDCIMYSSHVIGQSKKVSVSTRPRLKCTGYASVAFPGFVRS